MLKLLELAKSGRVQTLRREAVIGVDQILQRLQSNGNVIAHRGVAGFGEHLRELAYTEACLVLDVPGIRLFHSSNETEQRRFAGPVPPDEAYPLARLEHERGFAQKGAVADLVGHGVDSQKRHRRRDYRHFRSIKIERGLQTHFDSGQFV